MLTSATFTIVMSSSRMNTPRQTATSVHHLGSRPTGAASVAVAAAGCSVIPTPSQTIVNNLTVTLSTILLTEHPSRASRFTLGGTVGEPGPPTTILLPELAVIPGHLIWRAAARVTFALGETLPPGDDIHAYAALLALAAGQARSQQWLADTVAVSRTTMTKVAS